MPIAPANVPSLAISGAASTETITRPPSPARCTTFRPRIRRPSRSPASAPRAASLSCESSISSSIDWPSSSCGLRPYISRAARRLTNVKLKSASHAQIRLVEDSSSFLYWTIIRCSRSMAASCWGAAIVSVTSAPGAPLSSMNGTTWLRTASIAPLTVLRVCSTSKLGDPDIARCNAVSICARPLASKPKASNHRMPVASASVCRPQRQGFAPCTRCTQPSASTHQASSGNALAQSRSRPARVAGTAVIVAARMAAAAGAISTGAGGILASARPVSTIGSSATMTGVSWRPGWIRWMRARQRIESAGPGAIKVTADSRSLACPYSGSNSRGASASTSACSDWPIHCCSVPPPSSGSAAVFRSTSTPRRTTSTGTGIERTAALHALRLALSIAALIRCPGMRPSHQIAAIQSGNAIM